MDNAAENNPSKPLDVILASASPRRRQLLEDAGVAFQVHPVDVDESLEPDLAADPSEAVKRLAERKGHRAVEEILSDGYSGTLALVASDTMVVLDGRIFGKPADDEEAEAMLRALSGRTHEVLTAVSLWLVDAPPKGEGDLSLGYRTFLERTAVTFRPLSAKEIKDYIATGEPFDKAGAYGIQGGAGKFVASIEGDLDTVIGLPVGRLLRDFPFLTTGTL